VTRSSAFSTGFSRESLPQPTRHGAETVKITFTAADGTVTTTNRSLALVKK
jgi:hypothetical protein